VLNEECIQFRNSDSVILRGILHHAADDKYRGISLIALNTGLNDKVGWHRIQVKLSRHLAGLGYNVLRFDDFGIGDSDGELDEESIVKVFAAIETGLFVPDANAAVDFMISRFPQDKAVYIGFCGGALTAIHSAARNRKIAGIIYFGGPVTISSTEYLHKEDPWKVRKNVEKYKSKFFSIQPWVNLLSGHGEYSTIIRSLMNYLKHTLRGRYKKVISISDLENDARINYSFFDSFKACSKNKLPILFYFADHDAAAWEFKKYFLNIYMDSRYWSSSECKFIEVAGANHTFSGTDSQERMKHDFANWLAEFF